MRGNILEMLFYGLLSGLSEILPISAPAHQYLFSYACGFNGRDPLLLLCVHAAILLALLISYRHKIAHLYRENRIASLKRGRRKRQPDSNAVADWKLLTTAVIPILIGLVLNYLISARFETLWIVAVFLMINGILLYIPQYMDYGNRDARSLSRADGLLMGLMNATGILPGISRIAAVTFFGRLRKGNRAYLIDMALMLSAFWLVGLLAFDVIAIFGAAVGTLGILEAIGYLIAALAAFAGAYGAVVLVRYLAVRIGFSGFTYYSWGLGLTCFILYLMI